MSAQAALAGTEEVVPGPAELNLDEGALTVVAVADAVRELTSGHRTRLGCRPDGL